MVPAAAVAGDEGDADFDEAASEQESLAEIVAAVEIADFLWFFVEIKGFLRLLRGDEVDALLIVAVEIHRGILGGFVGEALKAIEGCAELLARLRTAAADVRRQLNVAHPEIFAVGTALDDEGGVLRAQEIGPARAGHLR